MTGVHPDDEVLEPVVSMKQKSPPGSPRQMAMKGGSQASGSPKNSPRQAPLSPAARDSVKSNQSVKSKASSGIAESLKNLKEAEK